MSLVVHLIVDYFGAIIMFTLSEFQNLYVLYNINVDFFIQKEKVNHAANLI